MRVDAAYRVVKPCHLSRRMWMCVAVCSGCVTTAQLHMPRCTERGPPRSHRATNGIAITSRPRRQTQKSPRPLRANWSLCGSPAPVEHASKCRRCSTLIEGSPAIEPAPAPALAAAAAVAESAERRQPAPNWDRSPIRSAPTRGCCVRYRQLRCCPRWRCCLHCRRLATRHASDAASVPPIARQAGAAPRRT